MSNIWGDWDADYNDVYSTPSYTPKKRSSGGWKSKYGGGGWSKSSWSNYSFVVSYEDNDADLFKNEAADLLFHYLILLQAKGHSLREIQDILISRHQK